MDNPPESFASASLRPPFRLAANKMIMCCFYARQQPGPAAESHCKQATGSKRLAAGSIIMLLSLGLEGTFKTIAAIVYILMTATFMNWQHFLHN